MPFAKSATMELANIKTNDSSSMVLAVRLTSLLPGLIVVCLMVTLEKRALSPLTVEGESLFQLEAYPVPELAGNCLEEYNLLHFTLVSSVATFIGNILLQLVTHFKPCMGVLVFLVGVGEFALQVFMFYIAISGVILVGFQWTPEAVAQCGQLHNTAWWIYIGTILVLVSCICVSYVAIISVAMAAAKARGCEDIETEQESGQLIVTYKQLVGQPV